MKSLFCSCVSVKNIILTSKMKEITKSINSNKQTNKIWKPRTI